MKKYYFLIIVALILGLVLTGCTLLSNISQVPTTGQSGIAYLTKGPSPSLVGLWRFNDNADDSSGTIPTNNGTVYGATYVDSPMGKALSFDGTDDYVEVGHADSLDMTSAYTLEAWVNVTDVPSNIYRPIFVRGATDANDIEVYVQAVSNDLIVAHNRGNGGIVDWIAFNDPPLGISFHLAITFAGSDVQAYYNSVAAGVAASKGTPAMTAPLDTDKVWWIGKVDHTAFGTLLGGNDINLFKGLIDEIRIWNVALPEDQLGDVTPPVVTITAPAPNCYKESALPPLAYSVVETNPYTEVVTGWLTTEGVHTVTVTATDDAGNIGSASVTYTVDDTSPVVTITDPADGGFYPVGAVPALTHTVVEANSYTEEKTGYSTDPGEHTVTVTATDCAGNEGSDSVTYYVLENFVTGGGQINMSTLGLNGKKAGLTFGGTVGVIEDVFTVGQFQIVDHTGLFYEGKGAVSWHCNNFTYLEFSGDPAESPEASHDTAIFEGDFTSNRGGILTIRLKIIDNGEPGAGVDIFSILSPSEYSFEYEIDGGNFQVHEIED